MIRNKFFTLMLVLVGSMSYGMNLLQPYNPLLKVKHVSPYKWQTSFYAEAGLSNKAYDSCGKTNALRIWNCDQDAIAMLDGFSTSSDIGKKRIAIDANNDGTRGHYLVDGDLDMRFSGAATIRSFFRDTWSISAYLPFYAMRLKCVNWCDQTKDITDEDARVKSLLTDDFFANVCELGKGLDLNGWERNGVGDLTLLLEWYNDFPQSKPVLKNARVNWWGGVSLPTGLRQDEDRLFAIPYGYDGAFAIPFGLGLDLSFIHHLKVGFDVQLTHIFGNTHDRRIKTDQNQTDLLLLQKESVYKDFGLTQQFNLHVELDKPWGGFSLMLAYQFMKHGRDEVSLCGNRFSARIANTAEHLKEWTMHQIYVKADYDFGHHMAEPRVYPRISLYTRIPVNGKRVALATSIGVIASIDF